MKCGRKKGSRFGLEIMARQEDGVLAVGEAGEGWGAKRQCGACLRYRLFIML